MGSVGLGVPVLATGCWVEIFNVGVWLTHGDFALGKGFDFLAVVEHRVIPARVRSERSRLWGKGLASIWAPACQDSSHVGNAGVGVVSLRGASVSVPTFATAQLQRFFDCGRAIRCLHLGFLTSSCCMAIKVLTMMLNSLR